MQPHTILFVVFPTISAHLIACRSPLAQRLSKGVRLLWRRMQLYFYGSVHTIMIPYMSCFCNKQAVNMTHSSPFPSPDQYMTSTQTEQLCAISACEGASYNKQMRKQIGRPQGGVLEWSREESGCVAKWPYSPCIMKFDAPNNALMRFQILNRSNQLSIAPL